MLGIIDKPIIQLDQKVDHFLCNAWIYRWQGHLLQSLFDVPIYTSYNNHQHIDTYKVVKLKTGSLVMYYNRP